MSVSVFASDFPQRNTPFQSTMQTRMIVDLPASARPLAKERRLPTIPSLTKREVDKCLPNLLPSSYSNPTPRHILPLGKFLRTHRIIKQLALPATRLIEQDVATSICRHSLSTEFTPVESMVLQIDNQNKDHQPTLFTVEAKGGKDQGGENQGGIIHLKLLTQPFGGRFTEATLTVEFVDPGSVHPKYFLHKQYRLMYIQIQMNLFLSYHSFLTTKNLIHCLSIMRRRGYMRELRLWGTHMRE